MKTKMYHYAESGLPSVWLANGYHIHETPYGPGVSFEDLEGLHRAIERHLVTHKPRLTGAEFRFLRRALDLSQARLAAIFGNDARSVALWEKMSRVPQWADRFLRALYLEAKIGQAGLWEIIERLNDLDRQAFERSVFEEGDDGWRLAT